MNKKIDRIDFQLIKAGGLVKILANQIFNKANIEVMPEQFSILLTLYENGDLYQREIGQLTLKDRPNINRILKILEDKSFITREKELNGRRKVKLTENGEQLVIRGLPHFMKVYNTIAESVTENELENCLKILKKITNHIKINITMQI